MTASLQRQLLELAKAPGNDQCADCQSRNVSTLYHISLLQPLLTCFYLETSPAGPHGTTACSCASGVLGCIGG